MKRSFQTNFRRNATIFGRKWYQILAKSKAIEGDWTVLRKTDVLAVLSAGYAKSLIYQVLICFLADGLNIFPQTLATDLSYVTFRFTRQTLQTSLQFFSFWTGFFSLFPNVRWLFSYRDPPASDLLALHALVFPLSFPFGRLPRRLRQKKKTFSLYRFLPFLPLYSLYGVLRLLALHEHKAFLYKVQEEY